jgi:DNA-directed RNA polymerase subunit RPC12/RpoP
MNWLENLGAVGYLALLILSIVVLVCWIVLPFAVFGIKNRFDTLLTEIAEIKKMIFEQRIDWKKEQAYERDMDKLDPVKLKRMIEIKNRIEANMVDLSAPLQETPQTEIACPSCQHKMLVDDVTTGHEYTCPKCKEKFEIG